MCQIVCIKNMLLPGSFSLRSIACWPVFVSQEEQHMCNSDSLRHWLPTFSLRYFWWYSTCLGSWCRWLQLWPCDPKYQLWFSKSPHTNGTIMARSFHVYHFFHMLQPAKIWWRASTVYKPDGDWCFSCTMFFRLQSCLVWRTVLDHFCARALWHDAFSHVWVFTFCIALFACAWHFVWSQSVRLY